MAAREVKQSIRQNLAEKKTEVSKRHKVDHTKGSQRRRADSKGRMGG